MKCDHSKLPDGAKCSKCGAKIRREEEAGHYPETKRSLFRSN
jgi:hypothetical protein